jgi:hypothetical protein
MDGRQQKIGGARDERPNPADHRCEWCGKTAKVAVERTRSLKGHRGAMVGTGQFVLACWAHKEQAEALAAAGPK